MSTVSDNPTACQAFPDPIPGIIPFGTVSILAGASGAGKSTWLAEAAVRWRGGRTICGQMVHRPTALYFLVADRPWADDYAGWFTKLGWPDVPHYCLAEDQTIPTHLRLPQNAHALFLHCLKKLDPIPGSHVIVDPMTPLFIAGDPNAQRPVAWTLLDMSRTCHTLQINITAAAYFSKQKADPKENYRRPIDRIAGSGAFSGYSHCQMWITEPEPPEQPFYQFGWRPRHAPEAEFQFQRNAQGLFIPFELYTELDRREAILKCVPSTPTPVDAIIKEIHQRIRLSSAQAERYLRELLREGRILKVSRGVYKRTTPS